jgi:dephospho-CoA kinase
MKIVVTGNIGCGKSTAVNMLRKLMPTYYTFFDFDAVVAGLYTYEPVASQLDIVFGTTDRRIISDIVHSSAEKMDQLQVIINPYIHTALAKAFDLSNIVLDIPLYFECVSTGYGTKMWQQGTVICVATTKQLQIERVQKRNNFSLDKIQSIMEKQMDPVMKMQLSDHIIYNTGSFEDLDRRVNGLAQSLGFID